MQLFKRHSKIESYKIACLTGLLIGLIFLISILPESGLVYPALQDSSHAVVFFIFTFILLKVIQNESKIITITASICISTFLIGGLIELIQPYFGRHQSLIDLGYDFIGSFAAGIFYWRQRVKTTVLRLTLLSLCASLLSLSLYIPLSKLHVVWQQDQGLPVLMDFDRAWEGEISNLNPSTKFRLVSSPIGWQNETKVAEVRFGLDFQYPGFSIPYVYGDWSKQQGLIIDIYSEETEVVTLTVRIHDEYHDKQFEDRFNRQLTIEPGFNNVFLSLNDIRQSPELRRLRVDKIASMAFFMEGHDVPVTLFFDNIKLQ